MYDEKKHSSTAVCIHLLQHVRAGLAFALYRKRKQICVCGAVRLPKTPMC